MIDRKYIYLGSVFLFLTIIKFINPPIIQKISFINYDFYQKVFNRSEIKDVTIVDIDEKSIAKIGQFPWRRDIYSKVLKNLNLHNPKAIAFDIVFSEEDKQNPKDLLSKLKVESDQLIDIDVIDTNKIFNRAETQDILGLDRSNKRQNMFFAEVLKDQGIKVENLPGGRQGYKLKDVLIALNDYSKNKLRNYESRKYASNLKKKSSENYELRSEVDGVDFVRLNSQINKSINKTLGKNDLYFPDSVGQIGHNPVPVTFYEKIEMFRDKKLADKVFNIQNYTWQG